MKPSNQPLVPPPQKKILLSDHLNMTQIYHTGQLHIGHLLT